MTRTATTKLVATALAVASLGLTATAQAAPGDVDPAAPAGTPDTGAQTQANQAGTQAPQLGENPNQGLNAAQQEEEIDYNSPEYFKSDEAKKRFERYCNMKDAEPSHSDKKFCEDFRKHNGTTTTTTTSGHGRPDYCKYVNVRYDPRCDEWYPKPHPKPHPYPNPHKPDVREAPLQGDHAGLQEGRGAQQRQPPLHRPGDLAARADRDRAGRRRHRRPPPAGLLETQLT